MPESKQVCGNCKWARFEMTPTDKHSDAFGVCLWPTPVLPIVAICYTLELRHRRTVWPETDNCPTWEPKDDEVGLKPAAEVLNA